MSKSTTLQTKFRYDKIKRAKEIHSDGLMIIRIPKEDFENYKKLMSVSIALTQKQQEKLLKSNAVTIMEKEK